MDLKEINQGNQERIDKKINIIGQNVWMQQKAVIWGNSVAVNAFIKKKDIKSIIKYYTLKLKKNKTKCTVNTRKKMINTSMEVNEIANRKRKNKINKTKN